MLRPWVLIGFFISAVSAFPLYAGQEKEMPYSLNIYTGQMTTNHWEDFFGFGEGLDFIKKITFEIEGQVVKHFNIQDNGNSMP